MRATLGPVDAAGRIPGLQQTRVASFLMSAHSAEARLLSGALAASMAGLPFGPQEIELHSQVYRELEILTLLGRATWWQPDPTLFWLLWQWETAWLPQPVAGVSSPGGNAAIDAAAFGYALHTAIRPATLLPQQVPASDPFAAALRLIESNSSRIVQAQLRFLKGATHAPDRDAISAAVERRHQQLRQLWADMLASVGIGDRS